MRQARQAHTKGGRCSSWDRGLGSPKQSGPARARGPSRQQGMNLTLVYIQHCAARAHSAGYAECLQRQQPCPGALSCRSACAERLMCGLQDALQVLVTVQAVQEYQIAGSCSVSVGTCAAQPQCTPLANATGAGALVQVQRCCRRGPEMDYGLLPHWQHCAQLLRQRPPALAMRRRCTEQRAAESSHRWCSSLWFVAGAAPRGSSGAVWPARAGRAARAARHQATLPLRQRVVRHALAVGLLAARPCSAHARASAGCGERQS